MLFSTWVNDCDCIWEKYNWFTHLILFIQRRIKTTGNVIQISNFIDGKGIDVLLFLQVTHPSAISNRFYES